MAAFLMTSICNNLLCTWVHGMVFDCYIIFLRRHVCVGFFTLLNFLSHHTIYWWWLDYGKPIKISHLPYFILFSQLIATLIYYPCTVALPGLADWSAFLKSVSAVIKLLHKLFTEHTLHNRVKFSLNCVLYRAHNLFLCSNFDAS